MPARIRLLLYPYNLASASAKALANSLEAVRVRAKGNYHYRLGDVIINWGNSAQPQWATQQALAAMLNKPQYVRNAAEKIRTFEILQGAIPTCLPDWTTSKEIARSWFNNHPYGQGKKAVVCRTLTRANSGRGITIAHAATEIVNAPLYTRYKPKTVEFRVHVTQRHGVVDVQQKRHSNDAPALDGDNQYVRSYDNGWVFCRENVKLPGNVAEAAEQAIHALGLDFGAVDVGFHSSYGMAIYEVNTAPGIEGQTLTNYTDMFRKYLVS